MSREAGYTLIETLMALTVVAMSVAGLTAGVQVLSRQQTIVAAAAVQTEAARSAQATLDRILDRSAPYRSQEPQHLSGESQALRLDCGEAGPCAFTLAAAPGGAVFRVSADGVQRAWHLAATGRTHFIYVGALDVGEVWPPDSGRRQALRSISVADDAPDGVRTLLKSRVWVEEPASCAFDPVLQDCR
jgi:type II secretory pathway pseudopilin PulG